MDLKNHVKNTLKRATMTYKRKSKKFYLLARATIPLLPILRLLLPIPRLP